MHRKQFNHLTKSNMFGITTSREPIKGEFAKKVREAVEKMTTSTAPKTFQSKTAKRKHIVVVRG